MDIFQIYNKLNSRIVGLFFFLFFLIWMVFLDDYGILNRRNHNQQLKNLEQQEAFYKNKIIADKARLNELSTNQENLEKFAREQFQMKNKNEDVYIVKEIED